MTSALADPESADLPERVKLALRLLARVTRDHEALTADDVAPLLAAGVSPQGVEDALMVAYAFNIINRLADAFGFESPTPAGLEASAAHLLKRGYKP